VTSCSRPCSNVVLVLQAQLIAQGGCLGHCFLPTLLRRPSEVKDLFHFVRPQLRPLNEPYSSSLYLREKSLFSSRTYSLSLLGIRGCRTLSYFTIYPHILSPLDGPLEHEQIIKASVCVQLVDPYYHELRLIVYFEFIDGTCLTCVKPRWRCSCVWMTLFFIQLNEGRALPKLPVILSSIVYLLSCT